MTVSVKDVAQLAGVSVGTVSNVLNRPERVAPATLQRVNEAITKLGFVRNAAASQLRAGLSRSVGLVVLDSANPFFTDLARGAEDHAASMGISVLVGNSGEDPAREATYLDLFEEQRVRGVMLSPVGDITARLERLRGRGIAAVLVDRHTRNTAFSSVSVDDVVGGQLAAGHLASLGRKDIAFVGGPMHIRQVADRLEGARMALAEAGLPEPRVIEVPSMTLLSGREVGRELARAPESERPDAIFAANDMLGLGLMQGLLMGSGLRIPEDIALIGYDDIAFAESAMVPMSSIRQDAADLGSRAMELLLEEAASGDGYEHRQVVTEPTLVVRASTRPA
ncbi:LacI family DNA-binding transcriptional regulator [Paeniglutamicibacter psychrophenolicus]|uniref:LacI family DNA-binding transcriptional regulator n=1 Tax=Paeniglutamicibacter psychrophenolicus TaxID=257454 RepID=UPI00278769C8|nr:LacI family DNA-binding transcriptional regulator [Paeniglutamicibacter psychrophenolicus]MDQ0092823.1 LacI family transcriptional regulator [Paeniglutamicibacter psychrophenolicus]